MAELFTICLLSLAMFIGCILAGWIPLAFTLSPRKVQLLTLFGAGLLVGTALSVIIPEGVETMYNVHDHHVEHTKDSKDLKHDDANVSPTEVKNKHVDFQDPDVEKHEHHQGHQHQAIGLALLLGFVFMLLVDQLGGAGHSHPPDIRLDELTQSKIGTSRSQQSDQRSKGHTATIGLVVHAAADGVAMGAAASTERHDLQFIVFLAIMLHKAPAAFGLVSFLVHEGLDTRKIKRHLLLFALAAPVLAIVTFVLLNQHNKEFLSDMNATGIAMLFSAGTFLYVATVHVLPELSHSNNGNRNLSLYEVAILVTGSLFPLLLHFSHSHG